MARGSRRRALAAALAAAASLPGRTASSAGGSPQVGYERLAYGMPSCPEGREITSEAECRAAVVGLGVVKSTSSSNFWAGSYKGIPRQCSLHEFDLGYGSSGGHWNGAPDGRGRADLAPVCRVQADAYGPGGQAADEPPPAPEVADEPPAPEAVAAPGARTVQRLTGSCSLPRSQFRASAVCETAHRRFWEDRRSQYGQYGMNCVLDPDSLRMNCSVEDSCVGRDHDQEVEVRHSVLYDCKRCDRDGETFHRLSCCGTCLALREKGIPVEGGRGNYSVQCGGCDDIPGLQEQAERAKSRFCQVEADNVNCTFSHRCELGSPTKTQHVTSCARTPCDRCGWDGPMRAECCSACLESACGSNSAQRHVCMGCDATRDLPEDNSMLENFTTTPKDVPDATSKPENITTTPEDVPDNTSDAPSLEDNVSTVLVDDAPAGSDVLRVESEGQLTFGDRIRISGGGLAETRTILAFGSVVLCSPLEHSYPAGSSVTKTMSTYGLGAGVVSAPQPNEGTWSRWFWDGGPTWQLLLTAGLATVVLAVIPAVCAVHQSRTRVTQKKNRGSGSLPTSERLCEVGADGDSDEESEELESREPLMASFSEALKQGPFQSCAASCTSPAPPPPRAGGSPPRASPPPRQEWKLTASQRYTCQLPPVHIAPVTRFSQKVNTRNSGGGGVVRSYKPLRCQSPPREPIASAPRSPQPAPRRATAEPRSPQLAPRSP